MKPANLVLFGVDDNIGTAYILYISVKDCSERITEQSIDPIAVAVLSRREVRPTTPNARTWKDVGSKRRTE